MSEATNSMEFPKTWGEFADYYGYIDRSKEIFVGEIEEVIPRFRVEQWLEHIEPVRPLPCVRDEHGEIRRQTVKQLLAKINEELDELKAAVLREVTTRNNLDDLADGVDDDTDTDVAEEAADTITAITTMVEAIGINVEMRDEAQRRVNNRNTERGRL